MSTYDLEYKTVFTLIQLQVLQISDILEYNGACNDQSVAILLVFLASQLVMKKNMVLLEVLC